MAAIDKALDIARGKVDGIEFVNKFGHSSLVSAALAPIATNNIYRTPAAGVALEALSSSALDAVGSAGAWSIEVSGLNENWERTVVTINMDGINPVAVGNFTRIFRVRVVGSGSYGSQILGSHVGQILIRAVSDQSEWAGIGNSAAGFPLGQTEIGCYTIPLGYVGVLMSKHVSIESTKTPSILWFKRERANIVTQPFSAIQLFERHVGAAQEVRYDPDYGIVALPECTDLGAMASVQGGQTAAVSVEFQIALIKAST